MTCGVLKTAKPKSISYIIYNSKNNGSIIPLQTTVGGKNAFLAYSQSQNHTLVTKTELNSLEK